MEAFVVLLCMVAMVLWVAVWRRLASGRPIVWTWRLVGWLSLAVLGAVAVPFLVVIVLRVV
jgi:hypothetical protein